MPKLTQYSGWYLIATGVIHNAIGLATGWTILAGMHAGHWWNTVAPGGEIHFARSAILWFLMLGFFWMLMGHLMQQWLNHTRRPLPAAVGWGLLASGALVAVVLPASGAWLVIAQGLILVAPQGQREAA